MGNCTASKLVAGEEDAAVAICRERKKLVKAAVQRRYALADAHARYAHSLWSVAAAINLFVTRHSTPAPMLITLPTSSSSPPSSSSEPSFLRQTPSEPKTEALMCRSPCSCSSSSTSCLLGEEGEARPVTGEATCEDLGSMGEMGCGYFFPGSMSPAPPSPMRSFGWDFFDPFAGVRAAEEAAMMVGLVRSSDEELRAMREEEGIPELEEEKEAEEGKKVSGGGEDRDAKAVALGADEKIEEVAKVVVEERSVGGGDGTKGLATVDAARRERERELFDALRDVEDHFIRACDSGKEVSRMLEATSRAPLLQSGLEDVKENSSKLIQAITWHRSPASLSSSSKSFPASSSSWSDGKGDVFDEYGGMESGSHLQTLARLYAWEKKLYQEVKAGDELQRLYERKCMQLRNQDTKGSESRTMAKSRAAAKELHSRIFVTIKTVETISARIEKLRVEELQPQLVELLQGLTRTWKVMLESHESQKQIMVEVKSLVCPAYGKFCSNLHRLATLQLDAELHNWRECLARYIAAQKAYVDSLHGWLSKFMVPEVEFFSGSRSSATMYGVGAPPLLVICRGWCSALNRLPEGAVSHALRSFSRELKVLWVKQGEEQRQKRKVEGLAKELDRRVLAFQKTENRVLESEHKNDPDVRQRLEYLAGRRGLVDMFRERLEEEKSKHRERIQETQRSTLNGFRTGFINVFQSLMDFSRDCLKMYDELLLVCSEKTEALEENKGKPSCLVEGGGGGATTAEQSNS